MTSSTVPWVDGKRHLWILGLVVPLLPFIGGGLALETGIGLFWWIGPLWLYGMIPLLDFLIGADPNNPPESAVAVLENDRYYRRLVYAYLPLQYLAFFWCAWMVVHGGLAWWELVGLLLTCGMVNGIGINTAHELGHKKESLERWLSKIALAPVAYGHFYVEHNRGHHRNVATPEDPASARFGETFWRFLPRTVVGSARSAWKIEKERLARGGRSVWHWDNDNLQAWSMTLVLFGVVTAWLGPAVLAFLIAQAVYGFSLLEVVNYIEHYGLLRQKDASGRWERCAPAHSWNSNHVVTNLFLYQLQRHSDHHANPTRRFQALRHFDASPQLPSGYASMLVLAYVSRLWFRVVDPLVVDHYGGDMTLANVSPSRRDAVLALYARTG